MKTALLALTALALGQGAFTINDGAVRTRGGVEMERTLATNGDAGVAGQLLVLGDAGVRGNTLIGGSEVVDGQLLVRGDAGFNRISDRTERLLLSLQVNAINTVTCHGGWRTLENITATSMSVYVGASSGAGTNNVLRLSDGTNNCDATFACSSLNSPGLKEATSMTGTCSFAAGSFLTICVTTAGCTPDPNVRNIALKGYYR